MHYPKITFSYPFKPFLYTAIRPRIGAEVPITAQSDDGLDWLLSHRYTDTPHAPAAWPVPTEAVIDAATTEWLQRYPVPQWTAGLWEMGRGRASDSRDAHAALDALCAVLPPPAPDHAAP